MRFVQRSTLSIVVAVIVIAGGGVWASRVLAPSCDNEVINEVVSPDGLRKAVLFQRECGATTGFSSQISVIATNDRLRDSAGNVLVADGGSAGYKLQWVGPQTL